ncbi:hypothetical protein MWN33_02930 [Starkeya koreensis]|uniref:YXWGXW repeat-containing protein n=1 Tax=Ancylobacter koreensis TaxID=266121 RepID=A0ABT0DI83_9HYPH|nr:hypothetical protein [Ancylobacter koreensis]MCK0206981.1 hypothetical protein [Ancylobacter koreensis]
MTGRSVMSSLVARPLRHLRRAVLAVALVLGAFSAAGLASGGAEAAVASPTLGAAVPALPGTASTLPVENVRWVCGPWRCVWRPNWNYWYVPPYARGWGPPVRPGCFWRRNWGGAWVHVCP